MLLVSLLILGAAYQFMVFMSRPKYSETGALLDSGNDLNMEGGIAEYVFLALLTQFCFNSILSEMSRM